ncbi:hypothetical protein GCM10017653_16410 [Ancylobacter defluvii]|uniref:Uncharacterized protein n=1 Tax=Ancylobacter defluvii TaxID=1282440 RepID=A0A9W6JUL7_9HYPH|nr:hypothetical protein GCM10017653_16410 [Ancylobacter defluvii]
MRWRYCRSAPINVPRTKATTRLISVLAKSPSWNEAMNGMSVLPARRAEDPPLPVPPGGSYARRAQASRPAEMTVR